MSRIGLKPLQVPKGVEIKAEGQTIKVKGPKGQLSQKMHPAIGMKLEKDNLSFFIQDKEAEFVKRQHGMTRTMVANMIEGVTNGYTKSLTLIGVGYRAATAGKKLTLTLGFSHPIDYDPPAGIDIKVDKQTTVIVSGSDKQLVGQVAADIRGFRPPEPYHGKGVRYTGEHIATKVGKSGTKTAGA